MERIDLLLEKLDNRIPQYLGKEIDILDDLNEKLEATQEEFEENPTDDNKASLEEAKDYIERYKEKIVEQLEALVAKKNNDAKTKEVEAPKAKTTEESKDEKKESSGVIGLVIGGVLLIASLGAINYFKNNR